MPRFRTDWLATLGFLFFAGVALYFMRNPLADAKPPTPHIPLRAERLSSSDLEVGGDLAGLPRNSIRYITRDALLALPQVSYTVTDDANFKVPTKIGGVELEELARQLVATPDTEMAIAICADLYEAHYPRAYILAHHPLLALEINGQPPAGWPKSSDPSSSSMGPYLISHPHFTPRFKILAHEDEAQIPWAVVRLEFRDEETVLSAIAPRGPHANDALVQDGYRIAEQNCFHCHNSGKEGGKKGKITWEGISLFAMSAGNFAAYVRNPQAVAKNAEMPGNPTYDEATMNALAAYFQTFTEKLKR